MNQRLMKREKTVFESALLSLRPPTLACFRGQEGVKACDFKKDDQQRAGFDFSGSTDKQCLLRADVGNGQAKLVQRVAVLFSGGPAPGGHNVIAGLKALLPDPHILYGVKAGPKGLLEGDFLELDDEKVASKLNLGGFDLLGSDRTKIKTEEQFAQVKDVVQRFSLTALVVIGGDDSNTNALLLAEALLPLGCKVIGVPKTIDGDLQVSDLLPISFGFDTAAKVYAELVGNILQDTPSSRKYWHVVKLMGRSASHIALEVGLKTKAPVTVISEAVLANKQRLVDVAQSIADVVKKRAEFGKNYGVILLPEGLIEFIPEYQQLIQNINGVFARLSTSLEGKDEEKRFELIYAALDSDDQDVLDEMPVSVRSALFKDRDSHGNVQVSQIPTEELIIHAVRELLPEAVPFATNTHFFGYEGRCAAPSLFDAALTYNLGLCAASLILAEKTGVMAAISELDSGGVAYGIPLAALVTTECRDGKDVTVIKKALVDLDSPAYQALVTFQNEADPCDDHFVHPGPIQFFGDKTLTHTMPETVRLNQGYDVSEFDMGEAITG
ncbi:MAG: diphosphate--fructose-6-phosphate 1-phosphotransferase [bacterium]